MECKKPILLSVRSTILPCVRNIRRVNRHLKIVLGSKRIILGEGKHLKVAEVRSFPSPITTPFLGHALNFDNKYLLNNKAEAMLK